MNALALFKKYSIILLAIGCISVFLHAEPSSPSGLTVEEFKKYHKELQPTGKEAWLSIPWKISLLDGQKVAGEEKKPLFIWAMDGHPLGCT